jgi:hypothetical protein
MSRRLEREDRVPVELPLLQVDKFQKLAAQPCQVSLNDLAPAVVLMTRGTCWNCGEFGHRRSSSSGDMAGMMLRQASTTNIKKRIAFTIEAGQLERPLLLLICFKKQWAHGFPASLHIHVYLQYPLRNVDMTSKLPNEVPEYVVDCPSRDLWGSHELEPLRCRPALRFHGLGNSRDSIKGLEGAT